MEVVIDDATTTSRSLSGHESALDASNFCPICLGIMGFFPTAREGSIISSSMEFRLLGRHDTLAHTHTILRGLSMIQGWEEDDWHKYQK